MVKKTESKQEILRNRVYSFKKFNPESTKYEVVTHFMKEGAARSTLYDILARFTHQLPAKRKIGSGRIAVKFNRTNIKRLKRRVNHQHGISQRALAKAFECSLSHVCQTLRKKTSIRYRKKAKAPDRSPAQKSAVRPKCSKLARIFRGKKVIIDDESYFGLTNFQLSGNDGYYTSNPDETPEQVKLKRKAKYEPKLLVWAALSPNGISRPYIVPSGQAINKDVYIAKCLRARLIPFIKAYHENDEIVFWPDLASSHYAKDTTDFLKSNNIDFVDKSSNPANAPELRPIEDFWVEMKRVVYANGWRADNLDQLTNRINYAFKKVSEDRVHRLGSATFTRVDRCRRNGLTNL